jgi:xanthine dehydrogenase YagS FAD-binding subunit
MNVFSYVRAGDVSAAVQAISADPSAKLIAGGTNLVDLMKEDVERPARLVDITRLPLAEIRQLEGGGLQIGALVTNTDIAHHDEVERRYPILSQAILSGASVQLRNMATAGGNLMQRTRCHYFYDTATPCNKREPATGCSAIGGFNRMHAILGASAHCIAVNPSDMSVALAVLDAVVHVTGPEGDRALPFAEFHRLPGETPQIDTNLRRDELITAIELPAQGFAEHHAYLKIRDRESYAFALVSVAAVLELQDGVVTDVRVALGGVAHKPWRDRRAEEILVGRRAVRDSYPPLADALLRDAAGFRDNTFKIELARRAIVRALSQAAAGRREP